MYWAAAVYAALWVWNVHGLTRDWDKHLGAEVAPFLTVLLFLRVLLILVAAWQGVCLARLGWRHGSRSRGLRSLLFCALAALVVTSLASPFLPDAPRWPLKSLFMTGLAWAQGVWATAWRRPASRRPTRRVVFVDLVCWNLLVLLLVVEVSLALWTQFWPTSIVFDESAGNSVRAHRLAGNAPHYGSRLNSQGYADDEFFPAESDDFVVVVIGDSFGTGVVPVPFHYASVAERALREAFLERRGRVAVHNIGVPSIGVPEYSQLLNDEALELRPRLVVVSVFVGNDLFDASRPTKVRRRYRLQDWLLWQVAKRTLMLPAVDRTDRGDIPEWVHDPNLETATFSEEHFLAIESRRREITEVGRPRVIAAYRQLFARLRDLERVLGEALVIAIIPDEFQVNDRLWQAIGGEDPRFERNLPQKEILAFCEVRGLLCVDFLPVLRAAEAEARTYHRRDTHWNARGNRVAGLELASVLRTRIETESAADGD